MRRLACSLFALALAVSATPALAQDGADAMAADFEHLEAAQIQAQAEAARPGDEALECDALEAEIIAIGSSPEMQAFVAASGAQAHLHRTDAMRNQALAQAGFGMALGLASAFVPGLGMAQGLAMQAQSRAIEAQGEAMQRDMAQSIEQMTQALPSMMRGQRVHELAEAKACAFLQGSAEPIPE